MSRCKCPKSETKAEERLPCFEDITVKMEERRCDLLGRQKYLRDKITTMERSIPALIAYNLWMSKSCDNAPYCKVREIMKRFSPYPDPTEKLLQELKSTVKELNSETEELHEKIIQADVQLEETEMELESIEQVNKEMNDTLMSLEKEVRCQTTPSLHSIHSEDLICLSKVRQLAEEELNLKNCIKELEQRETIFKEHMDRVLTSKEYQNAAGRRKANCAQDLECNGMNICCLPKCLMHASGSHHPKKKQPRKKIDRTDAVVSTSEQFMKEQGSEAKENVERRSSWMPNWWNNKAEGCPSKTKNATSSNASKEKNATENNENKKGSNDKPTKQSKSKFSTPSHEPSGRSGPPKPSTKQSCSHPCCGSKEFQNVMKKSYKQPKGCPRAAPPRKGCCEFSSRGARDHGIRSCKPTLILPSDLRGMCEICPSSCTDTPMRKGTCRCNCRGKCAQGLSDADCNCSDALDPEEYQPSGLRGLDPLLEDSNSDDDFCECCSCGCEDSDSSSSCECN